MQYTSNSSGSDSEKSNNIQHGSSEGGKKEGDFSAMPHEMTEKLMRMDLTAREHRLVWFFSREIIGYCLREKVIKTAKIIRDTALPKQNLNTALRSLLKKGVIERFDIDAGEPGQYLYRFNEVLFERVNATKSVKDSYVEDGKVIHIKNYKSSNRVVRSHQNDDQGVIDSMTTKWSPPATGAAKGGTKESKINENKFLRTGKVETFSQLMGNEAIQSAIQSQLKRYQESEAARVKTSS